MACLSLKVPRKKNVQKKPSFSYYSYPTNSKPVEKYSDKSMYEPLADIATVNYSNNSADSALVCKNAWLCWSKSYTQQHHRTATILNAVPSEQWDDVFFEKEGAELA